MGKGLLIFFMVLVVIAIIHFFSLRMMRVSEEKKRTIKKVYWYIYGAFFTLSGLLNMFAVEKFSFFSFVQILCGITFIVLNYLGKIETKNPDEKSSGL